MRLVSHKEFIGSEKLTYANLERNIKAVLTSVPSYSYCIVRFPHLLAATSLYLPPCLLTLPVFSLMFGCLVSPTSSSYYVYRSHWWVVPVSMQSSHTVRYLGSSSSLLPPKLFWIPTPSRLLSCLNLATENIFDE